MLYNFLFIRIQIKSLKDGKFETARNDEKPRAGLVLCMRVNFY